MPQNPKNIIILISGSGSNLKAVLAHFTKTKPNIAVDRVIADRDCSGLEIAHQYHIPTQIIARKPAASFEKNLLAALPQSTDLIVLAGFLSILPPSVIASFRNKIINIHPSLLPLYGGAGMYGIHVHEAVIQNRETVSGCTVHYVSEGIDEGKIIAQSHASVDAQDTASSLQQKVLKLEHHLLPHTIVQLLK